MKLNAAQRRKVEEQLGVESIPEEHPVTSELKEAFGDHTFFLDAAGLNIVERSLLPESSIDNVVKLASGNMVKLASWANDEHSEIVIHEPEVLPVTVDLETYEPDPSG